MTNINFISPSPLSQMFIILHHLSTPRKTFYLKHLLVQRQWCYLRKILFLGSRNSTFLPHKSNSEPQNLERPQKAITIQNIKWGNVAQGHSPTRVCRSDSDQRQNLQGEAGGSLDVLRFTFQVCLFQLSEGERRELHVAARESPHQVGLHASWGAFLFITGM